MHIFHFVQSPLTKQYIIVINRVSCSFHQFVYKFDFGIQQRHHITFDDNHDDGGGDGSSDDDGDNEVDRKSVNALMHSAGRSARSFLPHSASFW